MLYSNTQSNCSNNVEENFTRLSDEGRVVESLDSTLSCRQVKKLSTQIREDVITELDSP